MAGYIGGRLPVVSPGAERKRVFNVSGSQSVFSGLLYTPSFVHVYLNGVKLIDGVDFTAGDGNTITLTEPAIDGDVVVVIAYGTFNVANSVPSTGGTFQGPVHFADSVSFLEGSLGSSAFLDSDGFGSAAFLNTGSSVGDLVAFDSDGSGNANLTTPNITDSDGVTVQTTYVTNGSAKAWAQLDGNATLRQSLNVSSSTDNGVGKYQINYTNNQVSGTYSAVATTGAGVATARSTQILDIAASYCEIGLTDNTENYADTNNNGVVIHGDLA